MRQRLRHRARWAIGIRLSDLEPMTTLVALTLAGWADQKTATVRGQAWRLWPMAAA